MGGGGDIVSFGSGLANLLGSGSLGKRGKAPYCSKIAGYRSLVAPMGKLSDPDLAWQKSMDPDPWRKKVKLPTCKKKAEYRSPVCRYDGEIV